MPVGYGLVRTSSVAGDVQHQLCLVNAYRPIKQKKEYGKLKNTTIVCVAAVFRNFYLCFCFFEAIRPWLENMTVLKRQTVLQILGVIFLIFLGNSLRGCEFYCYVLLYILGCNNPET